MAMAMALIWSPILPLSQPSGSDLAVIFAVADNGLDGGAALLAFALGFADILLLAGEDDLGVLVDDFVATIAKINMSLTRFDAGQVCDLVKGGLQRMAITGLRRCRLRACRGAPWLRR